MSTTKFSFTSPSEITFTVDNAAGSITIAHDTTSIVINKDSGTRRWSVINDGGTKYFVEEAGSTQLPNGWPSFVMPFIGGDNCPLSLESKAEGGSDFVLIGTDDIRYVNINQCHDALWSLYNGNTTKTNYIDLKIYKFGSKYILRVRHSQYDQGSQPGDCSGAGNPLVVCIRKHE